MFVQAQLKQISQHALEADAALVIAIQLLLPQLPMFQDAGLMVAQGPLGSM
jgi:hypothetical protein